jgi:phytoene synthase
MADTHDAYVTDLVRREDRGRFVTALFAPEQARPRLLAIYAFNAELDRVSRTVSEPMLGQMRLQWWRDLITGVGEGKPAPRGHPVGQALAGAVPGLPIAALRDLIDAREPELAGATPAESAIRVAGPLADTVLAALHASGTRTAEAAREAAAAYGLARIRTGDSSIASHAADHIARARAVTPEAPRQAAPILLWTTVAEAMLKRPDGPMPVIRLTWNSWRGRY